MSAENCAVGAKIQQGVIEGSSPRRAFGDADGYRHVMGDACGGDALGLGIGNYDRLPGETALQRPEGLRFQWRVIVVEGVAWNEGLWEHGQPCPMFRRLGDALGGPLRAGHSVEVDWWRLDSGDNPHESLQFNQGFFNAADGGASPFTTRLVSNPMPEKTGEPVAETDGFASEPSLVLARASLNRYFVPTATSISQGPTKPLSVSN